MNYYNFSFSQGGRYLIFRTIETFSRTDSNLSWKSRPDEIENDIVSEQNYTNYITSVPFFNNFGESASCRAWCSYEVAGYLPTRITSISPYRITKKIASFSFVDKDKFLINAGWREKEIIKNAKRFKIERVNGVKMIYFYTDLEGDLSEGVFDTNCNMWRG